LSSRHLEVKSVRRRLVALTVVPLLLLGAAACGEDSESSDGASSSGGEGIEGVDVSGDFGKEPTVEVEAPIEVSETESEVLQEGDGAVVAEGTAEEALVHLSLTNATSGKFIGSTYQDEAPMKMTVAEGQMFPGVLDAIVGQPSGSRFVVVATPEDAYGPQGNPQLDLKADDNVVFVVDVLSTHPDEVLDGPEGEPVEDLPKDLPTVEEKDGAVTGLSFDDAPKDPPKELEVVTLIEGEGPPARDDSFVTFDYYGEVWGGKEPFDQSYDREPVAFPVGVGGLIPAWDEKIPGVKQGSRVMIIAPPETAYGDQDRPGIPANSTLVFIVDVLGVD
jgi:peptidylprolyl isomerase